MIENMLFSSVVKEYLKPLYHETPALSANLLSERDTVHFLKMFEVHQGLSK